MSTAQDLGRARWSLKRRQRHAAAMSLVEHLSELRKRLVYSIAAFIGVSIIAFFFYDAILEILVRPLCSLDATYLGPQGCDLIFTKVTGGFMFRMKVTALAGIVFTAPVWLYQLWAFITPGLTQKERRYAVPFILSSVVLFGGGAFLAYISLGPGLRLLLSIGGENLVAFLDAERYLSFVGLMTLGFGVMFELPVFLLFLGLVGVVSVTQLKKQRKAALVGIVALAAVVTPSQDPYTLLALAVPLYVLYEATILFLRLIERRRVKVESHTSS